MKNKAICIIILLRHGINPFGKLENNISAMEQRLTSKEKEFFVNRAVSKTDKKLWRQWLYGKESEAYGKRKDSQ